MKTIGKPNRIRLSYKISLVSAAVAVMIGVLSVIFFLLPIYNLVGEDITQQSAESDKILERAEAGTDAALAASYVLIPVSLVSLSYGVYQDVRKKSKN
jgi:hypothetical protein